MLLRMEFSNGLQDLIIRMSWVPIAPMIQRNLLHKSNKSL